MERGLNALATRHSRHMAFDRPAICPSERSPGLTRPFRFGVVAPLRTDVPTWRASVRRIADAGYSTLLMPEVPQWQPAPGPTLALAAAIANIRVGTWVYASPVRPPWITAWEAHSLSVLTEGRFEMGVGTGRPGIEDQLRELGPRSQRASGWPGCAKSSARCESSTARAFARLW